MSYADLVDKTEFPRFRELSNGVGVILVRGELDFPPTTPGLVPAGWITTGEVIDFEFEDGDWAEVWVLGRAA